jgi:hypothetical protein
MAVHTYDIIECQDQFSIEDAVKGSNMVRVAAGCRKDSKNI